MQTVEIAIHTPHIELTQLLKLAGICMTGGEAKVVIQGGEVTLNGEVETRRSKKIVPGDIVCIQDIEIQVTAE